MRIDLNCDLGELDDAPREEALMALITSANVSCGAHAGTPEIIDRTLRLALARGVRIGAHPGYPDRENFGRVRLPLAGALLEQTVEEQLRYLESRAAALGARIEYVKPHGALYNEAAQDVDVARAIGQAVLRWNPRAVVFGLAGARCLEVWREMNLSVAAEGFAERRYEPDGSLRARTFPDAIIHDPEKAAAQAVRLARSGRVDTICVHGDSPHAVEVMRAVARALAHSHTA